MQLCSQKMDVCPMTAVDASFSVTSCNDPRYFDIFIAKARTVSSKISYPSIHSHSLHTCNQFITLGNSLLSGGAMVLDNVA